MSLAGLPIIAPGQLSGALAAWHLWPAHGGRGSPRGSAGPCSRVPSRGMERAEGPRQGANSTGSHLLNPKRVCLFWDQLKVNPGRHNVSGKFHSLKSQDIIIV